MARNRASRRTSRDHGSSLLVRARNIIAGIWGTEKECDWWLLLPFALLLLVPLLEMAVG